MAFQKKLPGTFNRHAPEFWADLPKTISFMVRDMLFGRNIGRIAGLMGKTDSLLYKWADPGQEALPSALQIFQLMQLTENCSWIEESGQACGYDQVSKDLTDIEAIEHLIKMRKERPK